MILNREDRINFNDDSLLTTREAAKALGVSPSTLQKLLRDGSLPSLKIGASRKISRSDLQVYLERSLQHSIPYGTRGRGV